MGFPRLQAREDVKLIANEKLDMRPEGDTATSDTDPKEGEPGFETWEALQKATDKKRADIIADFVGHPKGSISVEELDYMNPPLSEDSIRRHLKTLEQVGVVTESTFEPGDRHRDYPYKFYELTEDARALFDTNGLFPQDAWRRQIRPSRRHPESVTSSKCPGQNRSLDTIRDS